MSGRIRLACMHCDTDECDGIDQLPDNWLDVDEFQSYAESLAEVPVGDKTRSFRRAGSAPAGVACRSRCGAASTAW